jgi:peptidyl-prolyl cis-trans isomerase C
MKQLTLLALALTIPLTAAIAQTPAPKPAPKPAAAAAAPAPAAGPSIDQAQFDQLLKGEVQQGRADTPELRQAIKDELVNRDLMVKDAKARNLDKDASVKSQMEMASQSILIRAYLQNVVKANEPTEADFKAEYDRVVKQMGGKEYRARHILVDKLADAQEVIKQMQLGEKMEKLIAISKDEGSKANGGDLDWASPGNYVKEFSDAMVALQKGKFTATPVQSQYGFHVIQLDDVRDTKPPAFEEVKQQIAQGMQGRVIEKHVMALREKAGIK